jgi:hypothetical protein
MTTALLRWSKRLFSPDPVGRHSPRKGKRQRGRTVRERLRIEEFETRTLLTGSWTGLTNLAPDSIGTMMLLSDGTVMAQSAGAAANQNHWFRLTPSSSNSFSDGTWSTLASMSTQRLYYGSNILQDGRVFLVGGEYSGPSLPRTDTNTGEIYNPLSNSWSAIQNFPQANFGDDPTEVLPDGRVLGGFETGPQTFIYNPATNSWTAAGTKLRNDQSDEEAWVKLPDNTILSYDVWSSIATGTGNAQRYIPSSNTWVDAGTLPALLSTAAVGEEMGPGFLLPDGRVFYLGGNGNTAYYTPSTNTWVAGPAIPGGLGADDAPGAMLPNGNILFAADTPLFHGPTHVYEFTPGSGGGGSYADVTPSISGLSTSGASFTDRMLVLPNGQVLYTTGGNKLAVWTAVGSLSSSFAPAVSSITGACTTLTLTGTQLNGISEGASYGDDAEMSSNYPIVRYRPITATTGSYARTANWSLTGVATGSASETVNFTVASRGIYLLTASANGLVSSTILNVEMTSTTDNLVIRNNPSNSANVQVVSGSTVLAEIQIGFLNKILVTCDNNADTLTVSYQFGNPLPVSGLDYEDGAGVDTLNVNDTTTTTSQTFTLGTNSVRRSGSAPITFLSGGINFVNVNGGSGGNTYNILGTEFGFATTINANGADTVNVGNAGNLAGIQSTLTLNNGPNWSRVNINDGSDNASHSNVLLTNASLTGLAPAAINFQSNSLRGLTIAVGNGNNTYTVASTPFSGVGNPITLNTGTGTDTVNVQTTDATAPLTVNAAGTGNDLVVIGHLSSLAGILGTLTLNNGPSWSHVIINDGSDNANHPNVLLTATSLSNLAPAVINFESDSLGELIIVGGSGNNTYTVVNTAFSSVPGGNPTDLTTGSGNDTVNVQGTDATAPLTVEAASSANGVVNVGNAGSLAGILGTLTLNTRPSFSQVNINDGSDNANDPNVILTASTLTNLAPAAINFQADSLRGLTITGGNGNNTYTVVNTAFSGALGGNPTTLNTGNGNDTVNVQATDATAPLTVNAGGSRGDVVNVGNAGSLAGLQGTLTLNNTPNWSQVNINDSADNANHPNVLLTAASLTNLAPAVINFQVNSLLGLTITAGNGNNTYTVANTAFSGVGNPTVLNPGNGADTVLVQGTDATAPLTVNAGSGGDTVTLTSASNTLDPISAVTVNDSTGTSAVTVDDSGFGGSDSYFVTSANVTIGRSSSFSLSYSGIGALTLNGGPGSDVFFIDSTSVATTVNGGGGGNIFRISPFTQYLAASILGPSLTLNGGGADILEFFDANDPNVEGFNFDPVPQSLTLSSTGTDITDFFGMGGGVYVVTNGMSNENDLSGTVIFDPSGGPPGAGSSGRHAPSAGSQQVMAEVNSHPTLVEAPAKPTAGAADGVVGSALPAQADDAALTWAEAIDKVFSL